MRLLATGVMTALAFLWAAPAANAQSLTPGASQKPDIKVDLVTGRAEPNEPDISWLGVRVDLGPGWKTYWKSPGDAGLPPEFDWSGSTNFDHAEVSWPTPSRLSIQGFETVGYTHEVLFPVRVKVTDPKHEAQIRLKLAVYACSTICVREERELSATIQPNANGVSQATIDAWRAKVPQMSSTALSVLRVERSESGPASLRIEISSPGPLLEPDAFIESDPPLSGDKPVITFDLNNHATLNVNLPGVRAEDVRTRTLTATVVSDGASVLAVSPALGSSGGGGTTVPAEADRAVAPNGGMLALIGIAIAGGFILNLMPCVFPVLSLKLLSFVHGSGADRSQIRKGFMASAGGVMASFLLLAGVLAAMKAAGTSVGWGIQFQQPLFLGGMAVLLVVFAGSQLGFIDIAAPSGLLTRLTGLAGGTSTPAHFFSGFVATLLATPCSAPLVGTAVGFALSQGPAEIFIIFAALGIGMASPYLLVAAFPATATIVPRPGPWLVHVKRLFGLGLLGTAAWLLAVLAEVTDKTHAIGLVAALFFVLALLKAASSRMIAAAAGAIAVAAATLTLVGSHPRAGNQPEVEWRNFSDGDLQELVAAGRTVFVDVTADWCITCKINKALVISRSEVAERLSSDVVPMRADWTKPDDRILQFLRAHGRFGIPFDIVFGPAAPDGIALPEVLTSSSVSTAFSAAAAESTPQPK